MCSHFNIEDGRKSATFSAYYALLLQEDKNATEMQKQFVQCTGKVLWLTERVKVVCEVSWYYGHFGQIILCCGAVLCIGGCLAAPLASTH